MDNRKHYRSHIPSMVIILLRFPNEYSVLHTYMYLYNNNLYQGRANLEPNGNAFYPRVFMFAYIHSIECAKTIQDIASQ